MDSGHATHAAFGLMFRSFVDLPEMTPLAEGRLDPDVVIEAGVTPASLDGGVDLDDMMHVGREQLLFRTPAGRFWVRDGRHVVVDATPGVSPRDLRLYLLGTVMTSLFHQRTLLALHAAAVDVDGRIVAIAGPSGAGKSTLAAQFHASGRRVWADDLCAIDLPVGGPPRVRPGLSRIKLWPEALTLVGLADRDLPRVADGVDKVGLSLPQFAPAQSAPLARLYLLASGSPGETPIHRLPGPEAAAAIVEAIHRWPLAAALGRASALFSQGVDLAGRCAVYRVEYEADVSRPRLLFERLEDHWRFDEEPLSLGETSGLL